MPLRNVIVEGDKIEIDVLGWYFEPTTVGTLVVTGIPLQGTPTQPNLTLSYNYSSNCKINGRKIVKTISVDGELIYTMPTIPPTPYSFAVSGTISGSSDKVKDDGSSIALDGDGDGDADWSISVSSTAQSDVKAE